MGAAATLTYMPTEHVPVLASELIAAQQGLGVELRWRLAKRVELTGPYPL